MTGKNFGISKQLR